MQKKLLQDLHLDCLAEKTLRILTCGSMLQYTNNPAEDPLTKHMVLKHTKIKL